MSLLLEALKKAEKAKEEAQRRARADSGSEAEKAELRLEGEPALAPQAERKPLLTRDKLPEISEPLEIVTEDLETPPPAPPGEKAGDAQSAPPPRSQPQARGADTQAAQRAAARKVFEAKFKEPNPRMPFYITMGLLGVFALGTVGYFWVQLRPPPALVNANPPRPAGEPAPAAVAEAKPAPVAPAAAQPIPGLPGAAAPAEKALESAPRAAAPAVPAAPPLSAAPAPKPAPRAPLAERPRLATPAPELQASASRVPQVHPKVESGYSAYTAGDLATARAEYQQALRDDPGNRDALFGMAALEVRAGRYESAEATYLRLLQSDPRDSHAQAALMALRGGPLDPLVAESRVKSMLAADPGAHVLNFTLGNQFAQQGRWAEAQQEYFKAAVAEPDNPDFAYNLAVSLDHMRQPRLALEYYQRAITLAEKRGASFDLAAARGRAAQLGK